MKKILLLIGLLIVGFIAYNFFSYPNFEQIENTLNAQTKLEANQINWKESYGNDVEFDLKHKSISSNDIASAKVYRSQFLPPKSICKKDAQRLAQILNDSASYVWGETTVEFEKFLIFSDNRNKIVALTKIDKENEFINTFPFTRTMKWGKLSKKGFEEFHRILNEN